MSPMPRTIVQSALLKVGANLTAQVAARWTQDGLSSLDPDWQRVAEFAVFGVIQAHMNYYWQHALEDAFPTRDQSTKRDGHGNKSSVHNGGIKWLNVISKLILDQTVGLFIMNTAFLVCMNAARLQDANLVLQVVRADIIRIIRAAWKIWPFVSVINFLWVPVESRVLVASCVGFGWNMFLAYLAMSAKPVAELGK